MRGAAASEEEIGLMNDRLAHRGPDGAGIWLSRDGNAGLGHRRLAILDLDQRADQPMVSADGRYVIVFNGEIYNFLELRSELELKGHQFRTESDTEVVLSAWREWGPAMLTRFNGMWAFAIYDQEQHELFLARDRFGVKPLLYTLQAGRFAFASEMRALLALSWVSRHIDLDVARRSVFDPFTIEGSEATLYASVRRLPAGHWMRVSGGEVRVERWWRTLDHLITPPSDLAEAAEAFWERFRDAVRLRMRSDVAIGTCLSGGFDSSAIAATMRQIAESDRPQARQNQDWRHAFIASFPGMSNDETPEARIAARYADIERPVILDFSRDAPTEHLAAVLDTMEDVFIGIPTAVWKTYRAVGDAGIRVSIDGHGADEMMGGYRQQGQSLQFILRNWLARSSSRSMIDYLKVQTLRRSGTYFLREHLRPPPPLAIPADADSLPKDWNGFNRRLYQMFHSTILPTLLRNFDRLSMAHSVEVRSPFLDWRLVSLMFSLPDEMKSDREYSKLVAREAMRGRMAEENRAGKRKTGFGSQMPEWLNGALGEWALETLNSPAPAFEEMIDVRSLRRRFRELHANKEWTWASAGRIWPYVHLNWLLNRPVP